MARFGTSLLRIVGELAGEGLSLWLLAVGCLHFNGTSTATPGQKRKKKKNVIGASIRIGREG